MNKGPIVLIIGTRPEGIKMAPVYHALKKASIPVVVICTMQHDQLLTQVLQLFEIVPDYTLDIMRLGQDLFYLTQSVLQKTKKLFMQLHPSLVLVQGDTTSSMAAALAAFYLHIPVGHVEAGLRTDDIYAPFPEEMNRRVISVVAQYHFAPTQASVANAVAHGVRRDQIFCTGNTVVDALYYIKAAISQNSHLVRADLISHVARCKREGKKIVLLTMHRRESFGGGIAQVLSAVSQLARVYSNLFWFYPYHPNPQVIEAVAHAQLHEVSTLFLSEPLSYVDMVYLLDNADLVLTDSGGIQEEAISLLKPVLVLREKTERMEGVLTGLAHVVGTDPLLIAQYVQKFLHNELMPAAATAAHTYGDGHAAEAIVNIVQQYISLAPGGHLTIESDAQQLLHGIEYRPDTKGLSMKKVTVVGLGYIGLPTAIVVAEHGFRVVGVDIQSTRVDRINAGDPDMYEPDMYEKLQLIRATGMLHAQIMMEPADYFIIAVPTPITSEKKADLSAVFSAAQSIACVLKPGNVVILESTVSVGATHQLAQLLADQTGLVVGTDFFVAHSPERVLPGKIFYELEHNDRIIGGITAECARRAKELYATFVRGEIFMTDAATAELVKLVENSARDVEIAFAHQVASMAYAQGLDPYRVIELANKHPRINILRPTCGVGGHCLAVDPWFLVETFPAQTALIEAARRVNDAKPIEVIRTVDGAINAWKSTHDTQCTIAFFGLTYKANVDDVRESPALHIVRHYADRSDILLRVCEPYVKLHNMPACAISHATTITNAIATADIVVFLVAHDQFKVIDISLLADKTVIDYCGLLYRPTGQLQRFVPAIKTDELQEMVSQQAESILHKEDA